MKTPREILSERHGSVEPKLDAIRERVLAEHVIALRPSQKRQTKKMPLVSIIFARVWQELICPCRRFWIGTAAAWVVILAVELFNSNSSQLASDRAAAPSKDVLMALKAQRQFMVQLLEPAATTIDSTPPARHSPRSEWRKEISVG